MFCLKRGDTETVPLFYFLGRQLAGPLDELATREVYTRNCKTGINSSTLGVKGCCVCREQVLPNGATCYASRAEPHAKAAAIAFISMLSTVTYVNLCLG